MDAFREFCIKQLYFDMYKWSFLMSALKKM